MKKGMMVVEAVMFGSAFSMLIASILLTGSFRVKKAVKQCGGTDSCVEMVARMDSEEVLEYIRDR